jgi:ubiquinone/menaquinone biosynthesis C-methylase UbiE
MESDSQIPEYALGNTHAEHRRLMRQAERLDPLTERLFREAGIGPGQRVLDIGSGAGDIAMLAARLVGISGEVVGLERDIRSIHRARARVAAAGLYNVTFTQCDVSEVASGKQFDAAVGRLILQFLPSPTDAVRALSRLVRPGGVIAFNEPSWEPFQVLSAHLPLYSATASIIHTVFQRCGANVEMGMSLHQVFQDAGLPIPTMLLEMVLGNDSGIAQWVYDLFCSLRPQALQYKLSTESLGNLDTLSQRLEAEVAASKIPAPMVALVGAWSRKPAI